MNIALILLPSWRRETPSLAIAYLASHLKKKGHFVSRFEFNLKLISKKWDAYLNNINSSKEILRKILNNSFNIEQNKFSKLTKYIEFCTTSILKKSPKVVAFSTYSCNYILSLIIAKKIKEINSEIIIIFGGPEVYNDKNNLLILKNGLVDYYILGEGEIILPKLLNKLKNHSQINIPGIKYINSDNKIYYDEWIPRKNINKFELPLFQKNDILNSEVPWMLPLLTNRGCTKKCDFCFEQKFWKKFRQRTPENVISEVKHQIKSFNITNFRINDSAINISFIETFCNTLNKQNITIKWGGNIQVNKNLNSSILNLMYKAGCKFLYFGAESGSDKILKYMNKKIDYKITQQNIKDAHNAHIWVHLYLIVGYPTETKEDFLKTIQFIIRNKNYIDSFDVSAFLPLHKTKIYNKKEVNSVCNLTIKKRINIIKKLFKHKLGYPYSLFLEKDNINYKKTKIYKIYNSKIKINYDYYNQIFNKKL
jgi:anaerobic magnesium-protoporphyrin IX monomethyl ester cyclase